MKIILRQDVEKIGKLGSCIKVKDGYARNYLLPKKLALIASDSNIKKLQEEISQEKAEKQKELNKLRGIAGKLNTLSCTVVARVIDDKKLYGSVDKEEIKQALTTEGFNIDTKSIILEEPIRELGVYDVVIRLSPEIESKIKVWVVKK